MTIERRACVNDISPEELTINTFGEKFTVLDLENSWSNFQTRKRDAPISSKLVSKNLWKKLKYDGKRISKLLVWERKRVTRLATLNNCNFRSILLYFSCISTFSIIPTSGSTVFSRYRKSQFFPNTILPAFVKLQQFPFNRQEMIHFRPVEESERTMDQFVFRTSSSSLLISPSIFRCEQRFHTFIVILLPRLATFNFPSIPFCRTVFETRRSIDIQMWIFL